MHLALDIWNGQIYLFELKQVNKKFHCFLAEDSLDTLLVVEADGLVDVDLDVELVRLVLEVRGVEGPKQPENGRC